MITERKLEHTSELAEIHGSPYMQGSRQSSKDQVPGSPHSYPNISWFRASRYPAHAVAKFASFVRWRCYS